MAEKPGSERKGNGLKYLMEPYAYNLEEEDIKRERRKARELRGSEWWKRKLAKGICYYCDRAFPAKELTMDHIVPVARGGKSTKGNIVTACKECNNAKKQLFPMEMENRGKLSD